MGNRDEVRQFLTTRRARITPDQVGLPSSGARRVPGLRRSEIASLAGVSVEYYARLERGQIAGASAGVLDALAQALQLDEIERAHLLNLARAADGIPTSARARRRASGNATERPSLRWVLESITDAVAFVRDPRQNLLATNTLGRAFFSPVIGDNSTNRVPNLARFQFLDPAARDFYPDWDLFAKMCVGTIRTEAGRNPHDRGLQDLVGELSTRSDTFSRLWAAHDVRTHGTGTKRFNHPIVGELTLAYEAFAITAEPGLGLLVYSAEPGSASQQALRILGSWATTSSTATPAGAEPTRTERASLTMLSEPAETDR